MDDIMEQVDQALQHLFGETARRVARDTGAVKRERKLTGADLLCILVFGWLSCPSSSREALGRMAARLGIGVSGPAIQQHLTQETATFLQAMVQVAVEQVVACEPLAGEVLAHFDGVLIEDSSTLPLPSELADDWPGIGNATSQTPAAAMKLQARVNVRTGRLEGPYVQAGRTADTKTPLGATGVEANCLRLADRGFWKLLTFEQIEQAMGFWLSYLHLPVTLVRRTGERFVLTDLLEGQSEALGEYEVLVGAEAQLPARLLALRVPEEVAEQRREQLARKAQKHSRPFTHEQEVLAQYLVVLTNVSAEQLSSQAVLILMRVRWQIELLFKLWKSVLEIDTWRSQRPWAILCEVYAKLIGVVVQHWLLLVGCWQEPARSCFKAAQEVQRQAHEVMLALRGKRVLVTVLTELRDAMTVGCRVTTRAQRPSTSQLLSTPALWNRVLSLP